MKCNQCGKQISAPLELYDGRIVCSKCGKDLLASDRPFVLTEENQAYFNKSEELYFAWLENADGESKLSMAEKAVDLCKTSAYLGNPNALARLGYYYDRDYDEVNRGENMRCRLAYRCYKAVCMQNQSPTVEDGAKEIDFTALQKRTAKMLFEMMKTAPEETVKAVESDFRVVKERIATKFGEVYHAQDAVEETDATKIALEQIALIKSEQRATLFGVIKMNKATLTSVIEPKKDKSLTLLDVIKKRKTEVYLVKLDRASNINANDDAFYRLTNENQVNTILNELSSEETVAIVYVNGWGKHKYYSKIDEIVKAIAKNRYDLARRLICDADRRRIEFTFYDDDLYYCQNFTGGHKSLSSAMEKLIETVCEGGTN